MIKAYRAAVDHDKGALQALGHCSEPDWQPEIPVAEQAQGWDDAFFDELVRVLHLTHPAGADFLSYPSFAQSYGGEYVVSGPEGRADAATRDASRGGSQHRP